jgi:CRP-like cAMP-binding protein
MQLDFAQMFRRDDNAYVVSAGSTIFAEGEAADGFFVVIEGEVDISVRGFVLAKLGAGELFGEMALIDERPRSATAVAHTDAKLVKVDEKRFLFLVAQTPYFALGVMRLMAERLRAMDETIH